MFGRFILSLRYRITITGLDKLRGLRSRTLILPNHPGLVDPIINMAYLWPVLSPRPMLFSVNFRHPLLWPLMKSLNAVEVPETDGLSASARQGAQLAIREAIEGLRRGENHLMWPAGRIYRRDHEVLGAASGLSEILQAVPDANIVVVRTRGLWGSMLGYAQTGTNPAIGPCMRKGLMVILANLIFFAPRRKITITVEHWERDRIPDPPVKEKVNPFFEAWYNEGGHETPTWVPYHFLFGPRAYIFPKMQEDEAIDLATIKPAALAALIEVMERRLKRNINQEDLLSEKKLEDLGIDSLGRMELTLEVEQRFGFASDNPPTTFGQLAALANGTLPSSTSLHKPAPELWFREPSSKGILEIKSGTVAEAFVRRALSCPSDVAAADDVSGVVTYGRMLIGALAMAQRISPMEGANIGIMLPSSAGTGIVFMAAHLAGRTPVMLNWTTGPANLAHAARALGLKKVVTSRRFIDRTAIVVEGTEYVFLEELRKGISKIELLWIALQVRCCGESILGRLPPVKPDDTAVVLFTSGSEKAPKAVPLTHGNLISNVRGGVEALRPTREDSLIAFLPAFHSFGLTATLLLPILGGMKVVYHPDPTDAGGLVRKVKAYRPTALFSTPTFLSYILDRSLPGDMESLEFVVTGAEKCPQLLMERAARLAPKAAILEGYGITECSPIISVNRRERAKEGTIGLPLPGVKTAVVSHETFEPLPQGQMGMLLVHGPNIFPGYIGYEGPSPFLERDGKRWYVTGDLVTIDEEGFIAFSGRLKRFIKAGGEMISLPALEEPFAEKYPPTEEGPRVAVEGAELDGGRKIVLFTTEEISINDANDLLSSAGFRGVMHIDEVVKLDALPVLGTGKTDYKVLRARITG
jgi:long-chain-fatty-acid--[acyl-carrier-protein] ligase